MGLSRTVSEIDGDFSRKWQNFPTPVYFGIGYRRGGKKTRTMGYQAAQKVWRYLQPCGHNPPMWQTDGRTDDTERQQRPRLHIASRSKNRNRFRTISIHIRLDVLSGSRLRSKPAVLLEISVCSFMVSERKFDFAADDALRTRIFVTYTGGSADCRRGIWCDLIRNMSNRVTR